MYVDAQNPGARICNHSPIDMNSNRMHAIGRQIGGKLTVAWGRLTRDPRAVAAGIREQLAGGIQERNAIARQDADRQLEDFRRRNRNWGDLSGR
jgi:uncharacterized protein YjbJ (UPF0337 family)